MIPRGCPPDRTGPFPIAVKGELAYWCPSCGASVEVGSGEASRLESDEVRSFTEDHPHCATVDVVNVVGRGVIA